VGLAIENFNLTGLPGQSKNRKVHSLPVDGAIEFTATLLQRFYMNTTDLLKLIRGAVQNAKREGLEQVRTIDLESMLDSMEIMIAEEDSAQKHLSEADLAYYKAQVDSSLAHYHAVVQHERFMFEKVILTGQAALKSAILINGGAATAILAFIGHIWNSGALPKIVDNLACSLLLFVSGVLLAAVASGTTYLSTDLYSGKFHKCGRAVAAASCLLVSFSYFSFGYGAYIAYKAFLAH
jgi:hypothetical protein